MRLTLRRATAAVVVFAAAPAAGGQDFGVNAIPVTDVVEVDGDNSLTLPGVGIQVNSTANGIGEALANTRATPTADRVPELEAGDEDMFAYHKEFWPLNGMDWFTFIFSAVGLVIAAGGGIGGGGILVPLYMIFLKFRPKHAIALSNFTILGGSIANTIFNVQKKDEMGAALIDWDIIVMMEPSTIAGAVVGSFLSKYLSDFILTLSLAVVLAMLSYRTLDKGVKMFQRESEDEHKRMEGSNTPPELTEDCRSDDDINESQQLIGRDEIGMVDRGTPWAKIGMLMTCFSGCVMLTVIKGSGHGSVIGVECGSSGFWLLSAITVPWVVLFGAHFRRTLIAESRGRAQAGAYKFDSNDVRWDARTTIKYPLVCSIAGVFAGLFGVGGGIVKGPLMLEMGVNPLVAAATAATMILFTTSAACVSFQVFGLLEPGYGIACFGLGLVCTAIGQGAVNAWMKAAKRQSPPVLSIGLVMALSTLLVALEAFEKFTHKDWAGLLAPTSLCSRVD